MQQATNQTMPMPPGGGGVATSSVMPNPNTQQLAVMPPGGQPPVGAAPPPTGAVPPGANGAAPPAGTTVMPPPPQTGMQPAPGQYSQWGDNPTNVMPPPPGGAEEKNFYGGQKIAGADPSQADYGSVQGYADQAYEQARRRIDPMQEQAGRRTQQDLINKGIDPSSPQGMAMMDQQNRDFADQNNSATFGALQFGQGIQNQMAQQEQQKANLGGQMQQSLWQNQLGYSGLANDRYGMDLQNQLGKGTLDYQRGQGEHNQMMDLLGYDMNVNQYNQQNQMLQDALYNQQYSSVPVPGFNATNPYSPANTMMGAGDTTFWNTGGEVSGRYGI